MIRRVGRWGFWCVGVGAFWASMGAAQAQTGAPPSAAAGAGAAATAGAAGTPAGEAPAEAVRAELATIFQAVQDLLKAGNAPGALTALKGADAIANRTPYEEFSLRRVRGTVAVVARDFGLARSSLEPIAGDARLSPAERRAVLQSLVVATQRLNDHAAAVRHARSFFASGGTGEAMRGALVRSLFTVRDWTAVDQEARALVRELEAGGRKPDEELLKIWASAVGEAKNDAAYRDAVEALVRHHPSPDYWGDLLSRVQNQAGFADRLLIDALRLMRRTGSLADEGEYTALAQLSLQAALPAEALAVLEEGFKAGALGKGVGAAAHRDLRAKAQKAATEDQAQLAASQASAERSGDANRIFAMGQALVSYGQIDAGLALMERAITMPNLKQPTDAWLRLAQFQAQAGRKAQALESLRKVQGSDGLTDLARLWALALR